jgi:anti-anti-sigma factor
MRTRPSATESLDMRGEVHIETDSDVRIVRLVGQHDLSNAADVYPVLSPEAIGRHALVIDLTDATFLDSTMLGLIFDLAVNRAEAPTRVAVVATAGSVADRLITVSGWGRFVDSVYVNREQAVAALCNPSSRSSAE